MASLVESVKYGAINTTDTTTNGFYVIMFSSGAYTLKENKTIDVQIITAGELVMKSQYLCSMQVDINWYWNQEPKQHVTTVTTRSQPLLTQFMKYTRFFNGISDNMASLVESGKYGAINITNTTTNLFYAIMFIS